MKGDRYEGRPCKYGHGRTRYTTTRTCVECKRIQNNLQSYNKTIASGSDFRCNPGVEKYHERWNDEDIMFATAVHEDGSYLWTAKETARALDRTHNSIKFIRRTKSSTIKEPEQMKKDKDKDEVIKRIYFRLCMKLMKDYPELEGSTEDKPDRGIARHSLVDSSEIYTKILGTKASNNLMTDAFDQLGIQQICYAPSGANGSNSTLRIEIQELRDEIDKLKLAIIDLSMSVDKDIDTR